MDAAEPAGCAKPKLLCFLGMEGLACFFSFSATNLPISPPKNGFGELNKFVLERGAHPLPYFAPPCPDTWGAVIRRGDNVRQDITTSRMSFLEELCEGLGCTEKGGKVGAASLPLFVRRFFLKVFQNVRDSFHVYIAANGKLMAVPHAQKTSNSKITPLSVIASWTTGAVKDLDGSSIEGVQTFACSSLKDHVVLEIGSAREVLTIEDLLKNDGVTTFYNHNMPSAVVKAPSAKKKTVAFVPDPLEEKFFKKCCEATAHSTIVKMVFIVAVVTGKIIPKGMAMVTVKQAIAKSCGSDL